MNSNNPYPYQAMEKTSRSTVVSTAVKHESPEKLDTRLRVLHCAMRDTHQRLLELSADMYSMVERLIGEKPDEREHVTVPARSGIIGNIEDVHDEMRDTIGVIYQQIDKLKKL